MEEPKERPYSVSVRLLGSSTAAVSWGPSAEGHNGSLISVLSTTCLRPSLNQRMESTYCTEVGPRRTYTCVLCYLLTGDGVEIHEPEHGAPTAPSWGPNSPTPVYCVTY